MSDDPNDDVIIALSPPYDDDEPEEKFYSEDQPRGPDGKWEHAGGGDVVAYHGTKAAYLESILRDGLKITREAGHQHFPTGQGGESVFVGTKQAALDYAAYHAAQPRKDNPYAGQQAVVLRLRIPKEEWTRFTGVNAGRGNPVRAAYTDHTIPPAWITGVFDYHPPSDTDKAGTLTKRKFAADDEDGIETWAVILVQEPTSERFYSEDQPRDEQGRWEGGHAEARAGYKTSKGTDASHNAALVTATGVGVDAPHDLREAAERAVAHVAEDRSLARDLRDKQIVIKDQPGLHGQSKGDRIFVSAADLRQSPGYAAAVIRHELEHARLNKQGVPSKDQEHRARAATAMWATVKYSGMAKTNPRDAEGFRRAAIDQGARGLHSAERGEQFYSEDQPRDEAGRWTSGGSSAILDRAPKEWVDKLRADARDHTKVGWTGKDVYFALGPRADYLSQREHDDLFSLAHHIEQASDRESMYKVIDSGLAWNTNYASGGAEWAAAQALGANTERPKGGADLPKLTEKEIAAFRARTEWVQEYIRRTEGETFTLYRGIGGRYATATSKALPEPGQGTGDVKVRGLTSWTPDAYKAGDFARASGIIIKTEVNVKDVFWTNDLLASSRVLRFSDDHGEMVTLNRGKTLKAEYVSHGHKPRREPSHFYSAQPDDDDIFADDREWRAFLNGWGPDAEKFYSEDQPRDDHGRWTDGTAGGETDQARRGAATAAKGNAPLYQTVGGPQKYEPPSPKQAATLERFADTYRYAKKENGMAVDRDGNVLFSKQGTSDQIRWTGEQMQKMEGGVSMHTHPTGWAFSTQDIAFAAQLGSPETHVVGYSQDRTKEYDHVIRPAHPEEGPRGRTEWPLAVIPMWDVPARMDLAWHAFQIQTMGRYTEIERQARASGMSKRDANYAVNHAFWHDFWTWAAPKLDLIYERHERPAKGPLRSLRQLERDAAAERGRAKREKAK